MMNMGPQAAPPGAPQMPQPMMAPPPPPQPVDPQMLQKAQQAAQMPTWDDIIGLFRDDRLRSFRIDIETDSTIAADEQGDKQAVTEFIDMTGRFLGEMLPQVQQLPELAPLAVELLKTASRRFKTGRQLEVVIDEFADSILQKAAHPPAAQPDPKVVAAQLLANAKIQQGEAQIQIEREKAQSNAALKQQEAAATMGLRQAQAQADAQLEAAKASTDAEIAAFKAAHSTMPRVM